MSPLTVSLIPDLTAAQAQKFIAINDSVAKLEGLAVKYSRSQIIAVLPPVPAEGVAYLINATLGSLSPGNFVVYTKPSNSSSLTLVPQVYKGLPGMTLGGYTLDLSGILWVVSSDPAVWGNNTDNLPIGTTFLASIPGGTISGSSVLYLNGSISAYPYTLPAGGSIRVIKTATTTFIKT